MIFHFNDIENLLMESQEVICKQMGITKENLEQSEIHFMNSGDGEQVFGIQGQARQAIKESIERNQDISISKDQFQQIIHYQIKTLNEKEKELLPVLEEMAKDQDTQYFVPDLLDSMISDIVFKEFNLEEEDYVYYVYDNTYFEEEEIMDMLGSIRQNMENLLSKIQFIPIEEPQQEEK